MDYGLDLDFNPSGPTACEASKYEEIIYYPLDMKSIYLLQNETYHLFYCKNQDWICKNMSYKLQNASNST